MVQKLWHKNAKIAIVCFCPKFQKNSNGNIYVLCYNFWTNQNLGPYGEKMARNVHKTGISNQSLYHINSGIMLCQVNAKTFTENWVSKQSFFCFDIERGLKNIFFRNKTFLFFKIELKFFEVSWNSVSALYLEKQKKFYS